MIFDGSAHLRRGSLCAITAVLCSSIRFVRRGSLCLTTVALFFVAFCLSLQPAGAQTLTFEDGLTYNDFFAVRIYFEDGEDFILFDAASFEGDALPWPNADGTFGNDRGIAPNEGMRYFFWIRRIGETGAVTYPLPFSRIKEIRFLGPREEKGEDSVQDGTLAVGEEIIDVKVRISNDRFSGWIGDFPPAVPSYIPVELVLTDNTEQRVYLKTDDFLGGIDEEFGTYGLLWLKSDGIIGLEFLHDGTYSRCPECGAIFYDNELEKCPFDGTELVPSKPR